MNRKNNHARTEQASGTERTIGLASRPLWKWRTVDLLTAVLIGIVFGVAFIAWAQLYNAVGIISVGFPPATGLINGFWFIPAIIAALIIRRPGAAFIAEIAAASVEPLLGSQWGIGTIVSGIIQGFAVELVFAAAGYRIFSIALACLSGAVAGAAESVYEWFVYYPEWDWQYRILYLVLMVISGIIFGALASAIVRALAKTSVLNNFPPGRVAAEAKLSA